MNKNEILNNNAIDWDNKSASSIKNENDWKNALDKAKLEGKLEIVNLLTGHVDIRAYSDYLEFAKKNTAMKEAWIRYSNDPSGKQTKAGLKAMMEDYRKDYKTADAQYQNFLKHNPLATNAQKQEARYLMLIRANQIFIRGADNAISLKELENLAAGNNPGFGNDLNNAAKYWSSEVNIARLDIAGESITANRDKQFTAANMDSFIPRLAVDGSPWAEDYFEYIDTKALPGKDGSINDLAYAALMKDYKNADKGSKERKFYDLMMAKTLLENGYSDESKLDSSLSPDDVKANVINKDKLDAELSKLKNDKEFVASLDKKLLEKTNAIIEENFVLVNGKITLKTKDNKDSPSVDGTTWARSALQYATSDEGKEKYRLGSDDDKKEFIKKYIGALSALVTPEETMAALGKLAIDDSVDKIMKTDLQSISDEDLATALETSGTWLMRARGWTNMIGNAVSVTREDWLTLARAIKLIGKEGGNPSNVEAVIAKMPPDKVSKSLPMILRDWAKKGVFGSFAALAGYTGAAITYGFDSAARERLMKGDPREVMNLLNDVFLSLSYAGSQVKGVGNLLGMFGITSVKDFVDQFAAMPGFGRLKGSLSTEMQPTFQQVADALPGVDLADKEAVKAALDKIDASTKGKWAADIGYDFNQLADRIVKYANDNGIDKVIDFNKMEILGFLFDMTGVDTNYKNFALADSIVNAHPDADVSDEAKMRKLLADAGMAAEDIESMISEMKAAAVQITSGANETPELGNFKDNAREKFTDTWSSRGGEVFFDPEVDGKKVVSQSIIDEYYKANPNVGAGSIPVESYKYRTAGLWIKGLGSAMDVLGGALGIGMGIWDIVKGAKDGNKLKITAGALGFASGGFGSLGGLAGFGIFASGMATPLFLFSALTGIFSLIFSMAAGPKPSEQFADMLTEDLKDYGITYGNAKEYLEQWYKEHAVRPAPVPPSHGNNRPADMPS